MTGVCFNVRIFSQNLLGEKHMKHRILLVFVCLFISVSLMGCAQTDKETVSPPINNEQQTTPPNGGGNSGDGSDSNVGDNSTTPSVPQEPKPPEVKPQVQYDTLIVSTTDGLQVRSGRGTNYSSIGSLDKNDMAMPMGQKNGWYQIQYKNGVGYVSASYVKTYQFVKGSDAVERVIDVGKKLLGLPYVYGAPRYHWGNGVKNAEFTGKSYDCSSMTQYMYKIGANINIAVTSREQSVQGKYVARADIKRGDLLFYTNAQRYHYTGVDRIGHVALYLGDNYLLHTASDHAVIEPISDQRHKYYITARRFL